MHSNKILPIIQWWAAPKLPREHIFIASGDRPKEPFQLFRVYLRKWLVHPVKRRVAKYYLIMLQKLFGLTVIGITGSAGKTTTKEMVASILKQKGETVASIANIDPVYNIPTTILKCRPSTKYLILEMGVEYPGEMDFYLWLARPQIGVLINIYPTHTEFFGSEKGVAREKTKLVTCLPATGHAVMNANSPYCVKIAKKIKAGRVWFGKKAEVSFEHSGDSRVMNTKYVLVVGKSKINVQLPIPGDQFIQDSLAAAATGNILGARLAQIKRGLESFRVQDHRMQIIRLPKGSLVIDDSYNNNPEAAKQALLLLDKARKRRKVVIFGDMLELGTLEKPAHREIGRIIGKMNVDLLITVGKSAAWTAEAAAKFMPRNRVFSVIRGEEVIPYISKLAPNSIMLVKGSRKIGLEKIVSRLPRLVR